MDSGNSGSIQSSSGGDEEYDSRQESISALLDSSNQINSIYNCPPPTTHPSSSIFDSLSNYLDPRLPSPSPPANTNSLPNIDVQWTRGAGGPIATSSPAYTYPRVSPYGSNSSTRMSPSMQLPRSADLPTTSAPTTTPGSVSNSKKRSRASRRAPTTVLTTDTSNFRAMVQEFTGIPAPPFSSSVFNRSRLDLFAAATAPPPYLLRPFAQKAQLSFANTFATTTTTTTSAAAGHTSNFSSAITPNSNSFQHLSSDLNLSKQYQNLLNINNSLLPFQSLLQPPATAKYPPLDNFPAIPLKSQVPSTISSSDSHLKIGLFDELRANHGHASNTFLSPLPNPPPSWSGTAASNNGTSNCKMKYTQGSADFHADKEQENVTLRGEGMLDSWISSSD